MKKQTPHIEVNEGIHSRKRYEVGLLINPATAWGRSIIAGVGDYSRTRGGWVLRFESGNGRQDKYLPKGWHGDGVIARIVSTEQLEALLSVGVPVINIAESKLARGVTTFQVDTGRIAQVAAEHFVGRGIRHFRFLGLKNFTPSRERYRLFHAAVAKSAESTGYFEIPQEFKTQSQARNSREELITWLIKLPRPVGLFCWCDEQARLGIEACQLAGLRVPEDIAILGVDNDELVCNLTSPPLSSVELGVDRLGYLAAQHLEAMMSGSVTLPSELNKIDPIGVIERQSTNLLAIDDVMVAKAMQLIMTSFDRPLQVSDIVASVGVSRRSLERRFVTAIGRTLAEEIRRLRMEHARRLLLESDLTVSQIAPRCGYDYAEHFIAAFHRMMGEPPQRFRERMMRGWRGGRPASMNSF